MYTSNFLFKREKFKLNSVLASFPLCRAYCVHLGHAFLIKVLFSFPFLAHLSRRLE